MYEYIKGEYSGIKKDYIVLENNGIGYKIYTSGSTIKNLPDMHKNVIMYTRQIVREDFIGLYGFLTEEELLMFNILIGINGVGPKAALSLLSISDVKGLKSAIISKDEKLIQRAPGIGKKTAERIILELKDKFDVKESASAGENDIVSKDDNAVNEAYKALISLGYSDREADSALRKISTGGNVEDIIKECLKLLMN